MRVLFISDVYFPRVNGVSTSIATFRADLAASGVDTTLIVPQYGEAPIASDTASIVRVPSRPVPRDHEDRLMRWGALQRALQALKDQRFDLVHVHTPFLAHYVGRVAHEKNIGFLIDCFAEGRRSRPDALLVIAGEGPARDALKAQAGRLGLARDVMFVGYLDRAGALADCYAAAAVFVFASRTETQGLVLLEAMAQGCPVVSTAHLGTASILQSGCGAWVVPEERPAFARAA